ncbi:MAG: MYXO-CTERM sorting domain-containing protein [Myxococcota bacterium]
MRTHLSALVAALVLPTHAAAFDGTALGEAAEALAPGAWVELPTSGLRAAFEDDGSSLQIVTFSYEMEWSPGSRQFFFFGGDHNGCENFAIYDGDENEWRRAPRPDWAPGCPSQNHSYNYHALDTDNGYYFAFDQYDLEIWRYDIARDRWDQSIPRPSGDTYYARSNWSLEYTSFGLTLVGKNGEADRDVVSRYDVETETWIEVAQVPATEVIHVMSQYNPTSDVMIFGGGDDVDRLHRLDADGTTTPLSRGPIASFSLHPRGGVVAVPDPATGAFLFFWAETNSFYALDAVEDSWTLLSTEDYPFSDLGSANDLVAAGVPNYGVVVFVRTTRDGERMWVYKHAESAGVPVPPYERDAGVADAGRLDAGRVDAGRIDAGRIDAGVATDSGSRDANVPRSDGGDVVAASSGCSAGGAEPLSGVGGLALLWMRRRLIPRGA